MTARACFGLAAIAALAGGAPVLGSIAYDWGYVYDYWAVAGPADTYFEVQLHVANCSWRRVDSGITDSSGFASGVIVHVGPGWGRQAGDNAARVVFSDGATQSGIFYSVNGNIQGTPANFVVGMPGPSGPLEVVFVQNTPELIAATGQAAWLRAGSSFVLRLPEHFVFVDLPTVAATDPADLWLGAAMLEDSGRVLSVPVLENARLNPLNGITFENARIACDGIAWPDYYWPEFCTSVEITPAAEPSVPLSELEPISWYPGIRVVTEPRLSWFDETAGGSGFPDFPGVQAAYETWMQTPDHAVGFEEFALGTKITDQYESEWVWFSGTDGGAFNELTGVQQEGDPNLVQDLTGYDGSYQPDGSRVYVRFQNTLANPDAPVTMTFGMLQRRVGGFVGCGVEGADHSFTVTVYGEADEVLGERVYEAQLWELDPHLQNYETFFGVEAPFACIRAVAVRNNATTQFADVLILDNAAWETGPTTPIGDWDGDGDADADDFAVYAQCLGGPGDWAGFVPPDWDCRRAFDTDGDVDVDLADCARLQREFTGELVRLPPIRDLCHLGGAARGGATLAWHTPLFDDPDAAIGFQPVYEFRYSPVVLNPETWAFGVPVLGGIPPVGVDAGWTITLKVDAQPVTEENHWTMDQVYMRAWLTVWITAGNLLPWGYPLKNESIQFEVYDDNGTCIFTGNDLTNDGGMAEITTGDLNDDHPCTEGGWPLYSFRGKWAGHSIQLGSGVVISSGGAQGCEDMMVCDGETWVPPAGHWGQYGGIYQYGAGGVMYEVWVPVNAIAQPEVQAQLYSPSTVPPPVGMPPAVPGPMFAFVLEKVDGPELLRPVTITAEYPADMLLQYGGLGESSLRPYRYDEMAHAWEPLYNAPLAIDRTNHRFRFDADRLGLFAIAAETDADQDGLGDEEELGYSLLPGIPDSDGDGLLDGDEVWFTRSDPLNGWKRAANDQVGLVTDLPPGQGWYVAGRIVYGEFGSPISNCIYVPPARDAAGK